tara:strand:- start:5021 stop:5695 length:675 start_codon:yes stop_codon:yes gene_type:complete
MDVYGGKMLDSANLYLKDCPNTEIVLVPQSDLMIDEDLMRFFDVWQKKDFANGLVGGKYDYRLQAIRFAYKVFAYTRTRWTDDLEADDWLIWLDADTSFTGPVTPEWLETVCPGGYMGSYIGRKDWDHSECGWIAFSMRYHGREFLAKMREYYTSELIFGLPQWHDSYIWDRVRQVMELKHGSRWFNLADGIGGNHPWPETKLGEILEHYKGPRAKAEKFGVMV